MKKQLYIVITTGFHLSQVVLPAFAQERGGPGLMHVMTKDPRIASRSGIFEQKTLPIIIQRADMLITKRLSELNTLNARTQDDTTLFNDQKTNITTQIQADITGFYYIENKN